MITELPKATVKIQKIVSLYWLNLKYSGPAWTIYVNQEKVLQSFEENFNPHGLHWIQLIQTLGIVQTMES